MPKISLLFFFLFIFGSLLKNINSFLGENQIKFWDIEITHSLINIGDSGEAYLTIHKNEVPEDSINFENTVIIGIDLENPDSTFKAKVHQFISNETEEIYKIDFYSKRIGKNSFNITLYDYENQKSITLEPTQFEYGEEEIEEIIPNPNKTNFIKEPLEYVGENDTITFEFSLIDINGNDIIGNKTFLKKLKVINNGEYLNTARINLKEDRKIFNVTLIPKYLPFLQEINVEFNGQSNNKFNLFLDNLKVNVIVYPFYLKTKVICQNCKNFSLGDDILIDLYLYNYKNVSVNTNDYSKSFEIKIDGPIDNENNNLSYLVKKEYDNFYRIITTEKDIFIHNGTYIIKVYEDNILVAEFEIILKANDFEIFFLKFIDPKFDPKEAYIDTEFGMILIGRDNYGNLVNYPLKDNIKINFVDENGENINFTKRYDDGEKGNLKIYVTSETLGYAKLILYYKGQEIEKINGNQPLPEFYFSLIKCIKSKLNRDELENAFVGQDISIYLQCLDKFGNLIKHGGEQFSSDNYFISNGKYTTFEVKIKDFQTGNYSFNFIPSFEGSYYIKIYLENELFIEITFDIGKKQCKIPKPYLCPNKNLCVENLIECIEPKNNCSNETPFFCKINGEEKCVESQIECDCPEGYYRCNYMKYCVPIDRIDMCANFSSISENTCKKFKQFKYLYNDGICRLNLNLSPTQKVCPIGKVLCADLSCRDNYHECSISNYCEDGEIRCGDQSCVSDYTECPSTISCQNKKYVCPDGSCVDSEVECQSLPICSGDEPYRCQDNLCVKDKNSCVKNIACGQRMALCQDLICRTTCESV